MTTTHARVLAVVRGAAVMAVAVGGGMGVASLTGVAGIRGVTSGVAGCTPQSVEARSRFVEDGVGMDAPDAWAGERVEVNNAGVSALGGVAVTATDTDRVHSTARMLAIADTYDKQNADLAILAATKTYQVTTAGSVTTVTCGQGGAFGSVAATESGCDALDVTVPRGSTMQKLAVAALSGNGKVGIKLDQDVVLGEIDVHAKLGAIDVSTPATLGASITVVAETGDDITLHLPGDFAADAIVFDTGPGQIDTTAFPDVTSGKGRGATGTGAKSIMLRSGVQGSLRGRIVLVSW